MTRISKVAGRLALVCSFGTALCQAQTPVYRNMTDAFMAAIDQHKFVVVFFEDSSTTPHLNSDLMAPVVERIAQEPLIQSHAVLGLVDLAHDEAGAAVARALNQKCASVGCPDGKITAPTVSVFVPDSKNIAEIGRLVGFQHDYTVRAMLVARMCESIQRHDPNLPAMDNGLASTCAGIANSRPSPAIQGWLHFDSREGGFSVELPGIPQDYSRRIDSPLGPVTAHYVTYTSGQDISGVVFVALDGGFDQNSALQAFSEGLPGLGKVRSVSDVRFQGYPGKRFVVEPKEWIRLEGLFFVTPRGTYQLLWQSGNDALAELVAEEFFQSFRLSPGK